MAGLSDMYLLTHAGGNKANQAVTLASSTS